MKKTIRPAVSWHQHPGRPRILPGLRRVRLTISVSQATFSMLLAAPTRKRGRLIDSWAAMVQKKEGKK